VYVAVSSQLMSAVPVLRGEGQLTDVRCLSEIKTPARSSEISSSGAMSVGTPRSLASSGQKNIQDIRHPLCAAEESASSRGGDALIHSGSGAAPAGGEKVRPVANTHRCLRDTLPCLRDSDELIPGLAAVVSETATLCVWKRSSSLKL